MTSDLSRLRSIGAGYHHALAHQAERRRQRKRQADMDLFMEVHDRVMGRAQNWTVGPLGGIYQFDSGEELAAFVSSQDRFGMWAVGIFLAAGVGVVVTFAVAVLAYA